MKKQTKGFTLVELLAVIVILAVILLIAVPAIIGIIDKAKYDTYENQLSIIVKMAETYSLTTSLNYDENGEAYFTLGDMIELGVAFDPITDPRCGKNFVEETTIKATNKDGMVVFELEEIISECEIEGVAPIISSVTTKSSINDIEVNVVATTEDGSIKEYYYSKDNGETWVSGGTSNSYTFTGLLLEAEYKIKVKVENSSYLSTTSDTYIETTDKLITSVDNGLIPITHNGTNWVVADINEKWYDYDNQEWANAISVTSSSRSTYTTGKVVVEEDVLAYYVYIPRYKYQLFNTGTDTQTGSEQTINIEFQSINDSKSTGSTVGSWLTHPAFTFGNEELEGIWVGKFQVTGSISDLTIKPNLSSVRSQTNSAFFYAIQTISDSGNTYGLSVLSDAHMMKNTEWGAAAYLSHSKYGINEEITINNNSSYTTGCGGETVSAAETTACTIAYGSQTSQPQSSTGNITGIYDMSGGTWERVMGVYEKTVSSSGFATSFFTTSSNDKYYNNYASDISNRILGDATAETIEWYSDYSKFVYSSDPWFCRGGRYDAVTPSGAFAYYYSTGNAYSANSTRVVVLP